MIKNFNIFEQSKFWDDFINKINKGILPKEPPDINNIKKIIKLKPHGKVLDISIGDGSHSEYFIKKGYDVYGTDISELSINTMKQKYPKYNWIVHDTEKRLPYPDKTFDIVFSRLSIHYFSKNKISDILSDIHRIIKRGGILFVMVKISNVGINDTDKKLYTQKEWNNLISNKFVIIDEIIENKKAYSFEKESNILQIIAKKHNI